MSTDLNPDNIRTRRVYEKPDGGFRVLVDRLWPRGLTKEEVDYDVWDKGLAPSTEERKEFHHEASRFPEFVKEYTADLEKNPEVDKLLQQWKDSRRKDLVLLYSAKDTEHNQAVVLAKFLQDRLRAAAKKS